MADTVDNKASNYDPHITPAEKGAREDREGENFKKLPDHEGTLDTAGGYTTDQEGLVNNFAIEPEMYVDEPGDLREEEEAEKQRRVEERQEINEPGGKGPGLV
ncbi:hypothetical protein [Pseudanabaena sp. FACHB-2040]|uniref:hypothetical protein n=1 Tax=Pseudanabaena sp. FACHB-2040 TaxID=2692859 RepID=UPI00168568AF|nr:hypothetical protein [Pseudanabaena sp. FACHB-2040]MBD2260367.1 hypothetical protein [Pseudanabaena sp. FACHB-2040]